MPLYTKLADNVQEADVIIAGGGTAGCIVASRLAEADPNLSILVIEQGPNNRDVPSVIHPVFYLQNLAPASKTAIFWKGNKAPQLAGREPIVHSGGTLGGGSSINFMVYTRAQRDDWDSWETEGWSAEEMLPFIKKLETYHGPGSKDVHGYSGPVNVSDGGYRAQRPEQDFLNVCEQLGWPVVNDLQSLDDNNAFERWLRYVGPDGRRQDAAHRYLHPKLEDGEHPNLHVVVESQVIRVLFDGNRAMGVEYRPNPTFQVEAPLTQTPHRTVRARKMVVVSCGAMGTPLVLERSGVGDPQVLQRAGVPLVADVPGVGHDYQDHHLLLYPFKTSLEDGETIDAVLQGRFDARTLVEENNKILGWNSIDVCGKIRPKEEEVAALGPEFQEVWDRDFKNAPNRPLIITGIISCYFGDPASVPPGQYITLPIFTPYPYSRGHMHITGPSITDPYDFDTGFLTDAHDIDLKKQIWAYKKLREVVRRTTYYRGELAAAHPQFPPGSKAACVSLSAPLDPDGISDLEYDAEDDAAIEQYLRENTNTTWHSLGTCKMAPRERMGAVDNNLSVYGTEGLKIADLSIAPENVAANTNNTALTVGEKAADIFMMELGLTPK